MSTSTTSRPAVLGPGEGTPVASFHESVTVLGATSAVSVHEAVIRPGEEPPMHVHANEDEIIYVLEGHMTFYTEDGAHPGPAGACAVLPRGIPHTFGVDSDRARALVVCSPAGFEGMFAELPAPVDMERAPAVFARYGLTMVGPNPRYA
jgi:quercetin dioxygenase-like cupin family protein